MIDFLSDVEFWTNLSVNVDDRPLCRPDSVPSQYSQVRADGGGVVHQHRLQEGLQPRARPQEAAGQVPGGGSGLCLGRGDRPQHGVCGHGGKYWTGQPIRSLDITLIDQSQVVASSVIGLTSWILSSISHLIPIEVIVNIQSD